MLMVVSLLANDPDVFPHHAKVIHHVRLEGEWLEIKIHRIWFKSDTAMRPRVFRFRFLASIDLHGVLPAGVRILNVPALDDDDLAIS